MTLTTDTPVPVPPSGLEKLERFIGNIARPWALYVVAGAILKETWGSKGDPLAVGVITALGVIMVAIYGSKAAETAYQSHVDGKVAIAQAGAGQ